MTKRTVHTRQVIALLLLTILAACSSNRKQIPAGFVSRYVSFQAERDAYFSPEGHMALSIPVRYDTLLSWRDCSDNGCTPKHRFTNAQSCLLKESGFFYREGSYCRDTLDRLTIETHQSFGLGLDTLSLAREEAATYRRQLQLAAIKRQVPLPSLQAIRMDRQMFHGRTFIVSQFTGSRSPIMEPYKQLIAYTELQQGRKLWVVLLRFECKQQNCPDSYAEARKVLATVEIDTLPEGPHR